MKKVLYAFHCMYLTLCVMWNSVSRKKKSMPDKTLVFHLTCKNNFAKNELWKISPTTIDNVSQDNEQRGWALLLHCCDKTPWIRKFIERRFVLIIGSRAFESIMARNSRATGIWHCDQTNCRLTYILNLKDKTESKLEAGKAFYFQILFPLTLPQEYITQTSLLETKYIRL